MHSQTRCSEHLLTVGRCKLVPCDIPLAKWNYPSPWFLVRYRWNCKTAVAPIHHCLRTRNRPVADCHWDGAMRINETINVISSKSDTPICAMINCITSCALDLIPITEHYQELLNSRERLGEFVNIGIKSNKVTNKDSTSNCTYDLKARSCEGLYVNPGGRDFQISVRVPKTSISSMST